MITSRVFYHRATGGGTYLKKFLAVANALAYLTPPPETTKSFIALAPALVVGDGDLVLDQIL
jgi:hypothetical protein